MLDYAALSALAAVVREGSFERAARALSVTPSAISQRIRLLEERLGCALVVREQPCRPTETGRRLCQHVDRVRLLEQELEGAVPALAPDGMVRVPLPVAVNADSLATWIIPALAATTGFLFDLVIDDQDVSQDWLKRGEVVAAVTSHAGPLQGCDTLPLGALRYRATASPGYVRRWFPNGLTSDALADAPAITFSDNDRLQIDWVARHIRPARRAAFPSHRMASSQAFVDACLHGLGWAMNPDPLAAPHLAAGTLVDLAPGTPLDVPLHWQFTRLAAPALAPVTEAIRRAARAILVQPG